MNDELDPFEQRLNCQPLRQVPPEWREEILAGAGRASRVGACGLSTLDARRSTTVWPSSLVSRLSAALWPHPAAWGGLAAVWVFILAVNFSMRDRTPAVADTVSSPSPQVIVELRQQQRLLAELLGPRDIRNADRQKMFVPKPRSEHAEALTA
ncbi:MAG TPA: hypothetical protein VME24_11905 [Alphaproteobacteria bacterium]|nr:hypothetical protein [Alphaproteobacteria bacterium]